MKTIAVLGSTGSVGVTTLDVVSRFPDQFRIGAMGAGRNVERLAGQVRQFRPELVSVADDESAHRLKALLGDHKVEILTGLDGAIAVATYSEAKLLMSAMVGALGLRPTLRAIEAGKDIAFANKEVLVVAGELVTSTARARGVRLLPVDSEHNAIFQCLEGRDRATVKRIVLTASGGPFRELARDRFTSITVAD